MIERARMQPDARGPQAPTDIDSFRQQRPAQSLSDAHRHQPEIRDLDRPIVMSRELEESARRLALPEHPDLDRRLREMFAELLVAPHAAVAPVVLGAHTVVELTV